MARSRAGMGQPTEPISFQTLDRQIPEFKLVKTDENRNETCFNDRSCLIKWSIESDGGAPIIRSEILYAKVNSSIVNHHSAFIPFQAKSDNGLEPDGAFSAAIAVDTAVSEYELPDLKPATNYIVMVKLYNEVGAAEQKQRITTLKDKGKTKCKY